MCQEVSEPEEGAFGRQTDSGMDVIGVCQVVRRLEHSTLGEEGVALVGGWVGELVGELVGWLVGWLVGGLVVGWVGGWVGWVGKWVRLVDWVGGISEWG